ncbi:MAG: sodium:calcium antiporter [Candidatus Moranbacteria bacterium]|nr:sodium:calcium antiporter [Candidatus Moranbacteria bacterium]
MTFFLDGFILFILFIFLGVLADFLVENVTYIGKVLKIRIFTFGILLGLVTTLPELFLGIKASIDQVGALSVGNILGGVVVILGLVLGISLIFHREILTHSKLSSLLPMVFVIFFPIFLGFDGVFGFIDGIILLGLYFSLILYLYHKNHFGNSFGFGIVNKNNLSKALFLSIFGIVGILITSHFIVERTLRLLESVQVNELIIGLLVFSLGTNLPEIIIAVTSWKKKVFDLSLSHILSSTFTQVLVLGILAILHPIYFNVDSNYWMTAFFLGLVLILFAYFYHSDKKMDQREGWVLICVYILFIVTNFYFVLYL